MTLDCKNKLKEKNKFEYQIILESRIRINIDKELMIVQGDQK